ncbi:MAG: NAD(+)/NADH kinase [Oscillospiraceae bacterium]|nr:NAD(+)/NADH kinase [Oscillospiraceae bacterium]
MQTRVLIGYNSEKDGSVELSAKISALLRENGLTPCVYGHNSTNAEKINAEIVESPGICSFIVTVGGDGTIIKWGKIAAEHDLPLLGVNMGRLGFMATLELDEISRIPALLLGEPAISRRMLLDCKVRRGDKIIFSESVVNDVIVSRSSVSKLPEYVISVGEAEVSRVRADGVILSTPTGSTAYSLSAGGPILAPDIECIEFTALCPHTLFNRPMIFSTNQPVTIRICHYQNSRATFSVDGGKGIPFLDGDTLQLTRSPRSLGIIETGAGFYGAIHNKLIMPIK